MLKDDKASTKCKNTMIVLRHYKGPDVVLWRRPRNEILLIIPAPHYVSGKPMITFPTPSLIPENPEYLEKFLKHSGISYEKVSYPLQNLNRENRTAFAIDRDELIRNIGILTKEFSIPMRQGTYGFFVEG